MTVAGEGRRLVKGLNIACLPVAVAAKEGDKHSASGDSSGRRFSSRSRLELELELAHHVAPVRLVREALGEEGALIFTAREYHDGLLRLGLGDVVKLHRSWATGSGSH